MKLYSFQPSPYGSRIMPWTGVKFDGTGQNTEATPVIQQVKDGLYHTVYPFDLAVQAPVWTIGQ